MPGGVERQGAVFPNQEDQNSALSRPARAWRPAEFRGEVAQSGRDESPAGATASIQLVVISPLANRYPSVQFGIRSLPVAFVDGVHRKLEHPLVTEVGGKM